MIVFITIGKNLIASIYNISFLLTQSIYSYYMDRRYIQETYFHFQKHIYVGETITHDSNKSLNRR